MLTLDLIFIRHNLLILLWNIIGYQWSAYILSALCFMGVYSVLTNFDLNHSILSLTGSITRN